MKTKSNQKDSRAQKKAAVLGTPSKKIKPFTMAAIALVLLGAGAAAYVITAKTHVETNTPLAGDDKTQTITADFISHPLALFDDGQARQFAYSSNGITIRYFILKSSDGIVRAAFDACDVCWRAGKGYYQDGDDMVCRNCGRRFASIMVNEVQGGCNPAPLNRAIKGDRLIIKKNDIVQGLPYFNL
jgi:uncharacterized membrane protein